MFEQTFKNIDDVLWKEAGCTTELDYTEQTSWILFLKYLDDLEQSRAMEAELVGKPYAFIIDPAHKWSKWAAPKKANGTFDHDNALTGDDLIDYVNRQLFPYLQGFKQRATSPDTIEYKIGEIFSEIKNRFQSGYSLRDALELIDELRFQSQKEKHELSHLYEAKIKNMGNAGRNGGEYYTPRPLIRAMIQVTKPKIGERIYDGALGSAGFLCEAYEYLRQGELTTSQLKTLQTRTFYGKEKKSLAYVIATMNMILHGIDAPNIVHTNTLAENLSDVQDKERFDVILANPPFGGKERPEVQQNFPIKTGETAFLFLQHFIKHLKAGGRAAIIIKNTFLSNPDGAARALRQELLESCKLHTILDCPAGTFQGAGVKTVVLFFEKGSPTRKVWYYQLDPGRSLGKTNPLNDDDLTEFVALQARFADSEKSWTVNVSNIDLASIDLSVKNPNKAEEGVRRDPQDIIAEIEDLETESAETLESIGRLHASFTLSGESWPERRLAEVCDLISGQHIDAKDYNTDGRGIGYLTGPSDFGALNPIVSKWTEFPKRTAAKGDILITVKGSGVGKVNLMDAEELAISRQLMAIRVKGADTKFVYTFLSMQFAYFQSLANGAAIPGLSRSDVLNIKIALPPEEQQQAVMAMIDQISCNKERLEAIYNRKLDCISELRSAILNIAFSGPVQSVKLQDEAA